MFATLDEIEALIDQEGESVSLEFKAGQALVGLSKDPVKRSEFVKDVSAFANAGGGTILYGLGEKKVDGISIAAKIFPVPAGAVTSDQLTQIIHANTDPPMRGFRIRSINVDGGQVFVVEIDEGHTATQNRLDYRFYQRVEATTAMMSGYAVRDVMNRRRVPRLEADVQVREAGIGPAHHNYALLAVLRNVGTVTAAHWRFIIEVPAPLLVTKDHTNLRASLPAASIEGHSYTRWEYSSERGPATRSMRLLPGEDIDFNRGFASFVIEVGSDQGRRLQASRLPLRWIVHVDNADPVRGVLAYDAWCKW